MTPLIRLFPRGQNDPRRDPRSRFTAPRPKGFFRVPEMRAGPGPGLAAVDAVALATIVSVNFAGSFVAEPPPAAYLTRQPSTRKTAGKMSTRQAVTLPVETYGGARLDERQSLPDHVTGFARPSRFFPDCRSSSSQYRP